MTTPTVNPAVVSPTAISDVSNPAVRTRHASILMHTLLVILVIVSLAALGFSIFLFLSKVKDNKEEAEALRKKAQEITTINPELIRDDGIDKLANSDDDSIYFALRSNPTGAEVYKNGVFIGRTPIEYPNAVKSPSPAQYLIVLDGYEIARRTFTLNSDDISETIELARIQVVQPTAAPSKPVVKDGITANNAVVITTTNTDHKSKKSSGKKKSKQAGAAPAASDIALPD